jgi:protoheme IX farnesyltransferase
MNKSTTGLLKPFIQLCKFPVTIPVSMTAFTGYYLFSPDISIELLMVSLGVLILASAASALNQLQEIPQDARMERTKIRPLPSNILKPSDVLIFVIICLIAGCLLLYFFGSLLALSLGLFTILWYNGIYTWLKKITAFAVIPGSVTGAIPPVIGWTAAGGSIDEDPARRCPWSFR